MAKTLEPEYEPHFKAWQATPNPATSGALLKAVAPVLSSAVRAYSPLGPSPAIKSQAKVLALNAFGSYDPAKGSLKNHLLSNLQRLRRFSGQSGQIIKLPERIARDRMVLDDAYTQLSDQLGREASDRELADYSKLSLKRIAQIRKAARPLSEGRVTPEDDELGDGAPAVRSLTDNVDPWVRFVYDDLNPRDQFILERALGMHGHRPMPPTAIAQAMKVSPAAISQRMAYIQTLLDRRDEAGLL